MQLRNQRTGALVARVRRRGVVGNYARQHHHVAGASRKLARLAGRAAGSLGQRLRQQRGVLIERDVSGFAGKLVALLVDEAVEQGQQDTDREVGALDPRRVRAGRAGIRGRAILVNARRRLLGISKESCYDCDG